MAEGFQRSKHKRQLGSLGWIEGLELISRRTQKSIAQFYGRVSYAQPPLGPLRFRRTRPLLQSHSYGTETQPGEHTSMNPLCPQTKWLWDIDPSAVSEDCLYTSVWVPSGEKPLTGWPVYFYIHGGFLQWGFPNKEPEVVANLYEDTPFKAIVVMPAYRLNALGFLASHELEAEAQQDGETCGNLGFWDLRTALEWTATTIAAFGGDPTNIALGGYSAGAYCVFHQLSYDLFLPEEKALVKRAVMCSNGTGTQPKDLDGQQKSFDEFCSVLGIPSSTPADQKLMKLRDIPVNDLVNAISSMKNFMFRGYSDGQFVSKSLIQSINDGSYGDRMRLRGVKLMTGETRDEYYIYRNWKPPGDSYEAVYQRLLADYPDSAVENVMNLRCPSRQLPPDCEDWVDFFGKTYTDIQIYALERGFLRALTSSGLIPGRDLVRYRVEWRAECVGDYWPREWKVSHGTDSAIWWWGNGWQNGLTEEEKRICTPLMRLYSSFISGNTARLEGCDLESMMTLDSLGTTEVRKDQHWNDKLQIWSAVQHLSD